jgi:hypothetical protein
MLLHSHMKDVPKSISNSAQEVLQTGPAPNGFGLVKYFPRATEFALSAHVSHIFLGDFMKTHIRSGASTSMCVEMYPWLLFMQDCKAWTPP